MTPTVFRHATRTTLASGLLIVLVAACGGGGAASPQAAGTKAPPSAVAPAATTQVTETGSGSGSGSGGDLAALTPAATISEVLGETPTPECSTSVAFGGDSCVWTAVDGSWVKVEHRVTPETPDLAAFTKRMTTTLGLETPVAGIGEASFMDTSSRGARIAAYLGDGDVVWVIITKPGDAAIQTAQLQSMAKAIVAGI